MGRLEYLDEPRSLRTDHPDLLDTEEKQENYYSELHKECLKVVRKAERRKCASVKVHMLSCPLHGLVCGPSSKLEISDDTMSIDMTRDMLLLFTWLSQFNMFMHRKSPSGAHLDIFQDFMLMALERENSTSDSIYECYRTLPVAKPVREKELTDDDFDDDDDYFDSKNLPPAPTRLFRSDIDEIYNTEVDIPKLERSLQDSINSLVKTTPNMNVYQEFTAQFQPRDPLMDVKRVF